MADQNVQDPNPLSEVEKLLPPKKRAKIESDSRDIDAQKLKELKIEAFYSVLHAFIAETYTISHMGTSFVERLMQEWNIPQETRISLVNNIQKNLLAQKQQQRVDASATNEKQVETKSGKKTTLNPTCVAASSSKWGSVNPETLVGKSVRVKMPGEDEFEDFIIKEYDSRKEMHRLEPVDPDAMEMDDVLSWIDVTQIPHEDIEWKSGIRLNFGAQF